jgi:hypothetical protein
MKLIKLKCIIIIIRFLNSGGLLPNVIDQLNDFENYIKWNGNVPVPMTGIL